MKGKFYANLLKKVALKVLLLVLFGSALVAIIFYARGYRPNIQDGTFTPTGILAVSSNPKAAKVYVNGELKGVTDLNLNLPPGSYKVQITKDGYTTWEQEVKLKGEIVTSLTGLLFPRNASLSPLTNLGIVKAIRIDQTEKVMLFSQNDNLEKDGIYIYQSSQRALSIFAPLQLILLKSNLPAEVDFKNSQVFFSPDYSQAIIEFTTETGSLNYLVSLNEENTQLFDMTPSSRETLLGAWKEDKVKNISKILETFPLTVQKVASDSFHIIAFSPDETKVLYKVNQPIILPPVITPPLIGANQNVETRQLSPDVYYVYDRKEDKNFAIPSELLPTTIPNLTPIISPVKVKPVVKLPTASPTPEVPLSTLNLVDFSIDTTSLPIVWYPDSSHLVIKQPNEISVIDYDNTNRRTVYSGPAEAVFFSVTTEGKLLILANLNPQNNSSADLYEVGIR